MSKKGYLKGCKGCMTLIIDKQYSLGCLFLGVGFLLIGIVEFIYSILRKDIENIALILGIPGLGGFALLIVGMVHTYPKLKLMFNKEKRKLMNDEQEKMLNYKSAFYGYNVAALLLLGGWLFYKSEGVVPVLWLKVVIWLAVSATCISYYWLTKDSFEE